MLAKLRRVASISGESIPDKVDELATAVLEGDLAALGAAPLVLKHSDKGAKPLSPPYDFAMLNADKDLAELASKLNPKHAARLCLYGPPGTGKTAWAINLAKKLGVPALIKAPSDIKSAYVGESEKAVAGAFAQAKREGGVLIFDEVDSYLRSRVQAERSHQVDLVNQFLVSMEHFNGILVCSTNLMTSVDEAALRRFDHKVKFDYLRAAQANALMHTCAVLVGMNLTLDDIQTAGLTLPDKVLTPGDFTVVLRQFQHDPESCTIEALHAALMAEAQFRQSEPARKIGFM